MTKIVLDNFYLLKATTGIKTYIEELSIGLLNNKESKVFLIPGLELTTRIDFFRGRKSNLNNKLFQLLYLFWKAFVLPIYGIINKADCIISPDYIGPFFGSFHKLTVVHSAFLWETPENYNPKWRRYYLWMMRLGFSGNTTVITTSEYTKSKLESHKITSRPIIVIYQCAKSLSMHYNNLDISRLLFLKNYTYFLHVGYFDKRKNLKTLVKAFQLIKNKYPDTKLVLAGGRGASSYDDDYPEIEQIITESNLKEHVFLPGYVSDPELSFLYNHAFCYVFPSTDEGFGIPILEAYKFNLPVIISDKGALQEIAGEAALVFKSDEISELKNHLEMLINNQFLRDQLIKKGNIRLANFSKENFVNGFLNLVLLNEKSFSTS